MARRFFAPVLMSAIEDPQTGDVGVHITSDQREQTAGVLSWRLTDTAGTLLAENRLDCPIKPLSDTKTMNVQFADHLREHGARKLLVWLALKVDGKVVSEDVVFFTRPKHLELQAPQFTTQISKQPDGAFELTIDATVPAVWVWPELSGVNATYSDRFFHLAPGKPVSVVVTPERALSEDEFRQALLMRSLVDTWA